MRCKRLLAVLMTLSLFLLAGTGVFADGIRYIRDSNGNYIPVYVGDTTGANSSGFVIKNGVLTGYTGKSSRVVIPSSVKKIDKLAFGSCYTIKEVVIPSSVTFIGEGAFYNCTGLQSVTIPGSVDSMGPSAFMRCDGLRSVLIEYGVGKIEEQAFLYCGSLETVSIPTSVTEIGESAFSYCTGLKSILIPSSVTSIEKAAFYNCAALEQIYIPLSVQTIGEMAFMGCTNLSTVSNMSGVKNIGKLAFSESGIQSFTFPNTLKTIGEGAFSNCDQLKKVIFPDSLTQIGDSAFLTCGGLEYVSISKNVRSVGEMAFAGCPNLKDVELQALNPIIGNVAFNGSKVENVTYAGSKSQWSAANLQKHFPAGVNVIFERHDISICTQPTDKTVKLGSTVTLSIKAEGDGLTYQWYCKKSGQTTFSKWSGKTSSSVTETPDATWNGMRVYCIVKDSSDHSIQSNTVTITVTQDLKITIQPTSKTVKLGSSVTLSLKAEGNGLTYQWYYKKAGQTTWQKWNLFATNITTTTNSTWNGNTSSSVTGNSDATWNGMQVYCVVKDSLGHSIQSDTVTITVKQQELIITTQPTNKTVNLDSNVTLSIKAEGDGLTYQWYYKKAGQTSWKKWDYSISRTTTYTTATTNSTWNGNTSSSITGTSDATWNGMQVYCVVKDSYGHSVQSNTVTITVTQGLKITTQPTGKTIKSGSSVTLSLKAEGDGLTYQWYYQKAGQTKFSAWENRTHASETCKPNATWNGIQLYCIVKDRNGNSVQSNTIKVTFSDVVTIVTQPANVSAKAGESVKLTVKAEGVGLSYHWYYKKSGAKSWTKWSKQTKSTVSFKMASGWNKAQFYCQVKNKAGKRVKTQSAKATLLVEFKITTQPKNKTVKTGKTATFSIKATGNGLKYQWYYKKKGAKSWTKWSGKTKASVSLKATKAWNGAQFYCKVTDGNKKTANSKSAKLTLKK